MIVTALGTASGTDQLAPTSSFLIDADTLLDCGSGAETLSIESMLHIERVLLTHSHLDHCSALPALLACHAAHGGTGITVHTQLETIDALYAKLFNDQDYPNYTQLKTAGGDPLLRFNAIEVGDALPLPDGMATALPAQHNIPAVGWLVEGPWRALAYTGDTSLCPGFWHWISNVPSISDIVCEITYPSSRSEQARAEGHMTPDQLLPMLALVPPNVHIWISHLGSADKEQVLQELRQQAPVAVNIGELKVDTIIDL